MAQRLKRLPGIQETWVRSLGREDPLEEEMATYTSIIAWRIPWREEPGRLQSMGLQRVGHGGATSLSLLLLHCRQILYQLSYQGGPDDRTEIQIQVHIITSPFC